MRNTFIIVLFFKDVLQFISLVFELIFSKFRKKSKWCLISMFNCFSYDPWKNILNVVFILNSHFYNFIYFFRCSVYEFMCLICKFIYSLHTLSFFFYLFLFLFLFRANIIFNVFFEKALLLSYDKNDLSNSEKKLEKNLAFLETKKVILQTKLKKYNKFSQKYFGLL